MSLKHSVLVWRHRHCSFTCFWQFWGSAWYSSSCKWSKSRGAPSRKTPKSYCHYFPILSKSRWKQYRSFSSDCKQEKLWNNWLLHQKYHERKKNSIECGLSSLKLSFCLLLLQLIKTVFVAMHWFTEYASICHVWSGTKPTPKPLIGFETCKRVALWATPQSLSHSSSIF